MRNTNRTRTLIAATVMLMASAGAALADGWYTTPFVIWVKEGSEGKPHTPLAQLYDQVPHFDNRAVAQAQGAAGNSAGKPTAADN
jgi:hypothetical protein